MLVIHIDEIMKRIFKGLLYFVLGLLTLIILGLAYLYISSSSDSNKNMAELGPEAPTLLIDSQSYRDLNKNGKLDVYEDTRQPVETRVNDLLNQMNLEEKAGLMFITMTAIGNEGELSETKTITNPFGLPFESNSSLVVKKKMNHVEIILKLIILTILMVMNRIILNIKWVAQQ